jgi:histidine kinase/DNA gyrase B/HSP90-like ATPase
MAGHERITGTGLGLAIARDLARRMDGDLDVASVAGAGSAFVLVLPGPAEVEPTSIAAALARALAAEADGLADRLALRAIAPARPQVVGAIGDAGVRPDRRSGVGRLRAVPTVSPGARTPA